MSNWEKVRDAKRAVRDSLIPAEYRIPKGHVIWAARSSNASDIAVLELSGLLSAEDLKITRMSASEVASEIAAGRLSSELAVRVRLCPGDIPWI